MSQAGLARISSGNLPPSVPISFVTNAGTATPALGVLQILGVTGPAGTTPVSTSAPGSLNIVDVIVQTSQAIAATNASNIGLAAFNSAQFTVDANGFVSASGTGIAQTITGNSGGPRPPTAGNWNIITANATPTFVGAGSTLTLDFSLTNIVLGSALPVLTSGTNNVGMGQAIMGTITSGSQNVGIGNLCLNSIISSVQNTCVGFASGRMISTGAGTNAFFGTSSGATLTTGSANTGIGQGALSNLLTGVSNVGIGSSSGNVYNGSESSNILISNVGVIGESNVMRLGTQGSGPGQQLQTFIAGVVNTVSGRVVKTTVPGAYPYTTLTTDYVILVDTSSARTINLNAAPVTGTTFRIKDNVGTAAANNITVTPNAGTIDGAASYVVNTNWGSIDIVYNGTSWRLV